MGTAGISAHHRILIVEDDYILAEDLALSLKAVGAGVIGPFSRIDEAKHALSLRAGGISAAILDINIAGERIYPVAEDLRDAGIPFVFVTGYDAHAIPAPFSTVPRLGKPVGRQELLDKLAEIVGH